MKPGPDAPVETLHFSSEPCESADFQAHAISPAGRPGFIAEICARDWGLWRTAKATIERCKTNLPGYELDRAAQDLIVERLDVLWARIEQAPKSTKWRLRSRVGDRVRWYEEPEEHASTN